jgi:predicted transcriptional regulator
MDRERDAQETRTAETLQALVSVESGRYVEGEAVFAWVATWGTGQEAEPPRCGEQAGS